MKRSLMILIVFLYIFSGYAAPAPATDKVPVFVSILPQKFFVQQIGKERVDVQVMVQPGASPATYEPKPRQMADLATTDVYFAIGVPFENAWLQKIAAANPQMTVVHTDRGIEKAAMAGHHHQDDHGPANEADGHDHAKAHHPRTGDRDHAQGEHHGEAGREKDHREPAGLDPHIWLSPPLVRTQARTITAALQAIDPVHRDVFDANFRQFVAQIDRLDNELRQILHGRSGMQFMVFHPAWGYFAKAYGLVQVPIEIEGKNPKPAQLKEMIQHARKSGIRVVFAQPQFSTKSASIVAREIDGQVVFADPLAEDWMSNLRDVAAKFEAALR